MRWTVMILVVAGCGELERSAPEVVDPVDGVLYGVPLPGEQDQGRHRLSAIADGFVTPSSTRHISTVVQSTKACPTCDSYTLSANDGALVATGPNGPVPIGSIVPLSIATSAGGIGGTITITGVLSNPPRYTLTFNGAPYCGAGDGAVVFSGYWRTDGRHISDTTALTFSCREDGVIAKCFTWGYRPGESEGIGDALDPWTVHQACTHMAMAAYCGDGVTHTFDDTTIVIRDNNFPNAQPDLSTNALVHPSVHPAPPDQFWFEAAWNGGGVSNKHGAVCLSHERWKSMPLGGPGCPDLPDPRLIGSTGKYCEDAGDTVQAAVMFNSSRIGQMYLGLWRKPSNNDRLVTVRGTRHMDTAHYVGSDDAPYPGFTRYEGTVGIVMRNPPDSMTIGVDLYEVDSAGTAGDRYIDLGTLGPASPRYEGFVYSTWALDRLELKNWRHMTTNDRVTAVDPPSPDYVEVPPSLGYIDQP